MMGRSEKACRSISRSGAIGVMAVFCLAVVVLVASNNQVIVISTNLVGSASNLNHRWEPTSAAGSAWVTGWYEIEAGNSYASAWNGVWSAPQALTSPNGFGTMDLNMAWDPLRNRFVFVALDNLNPHNIWYGYTTDSSGAHWAFGNQPTGGQPQPILGAIGTQGWDYPSVGVDASGRVIAGAVKIAPCPPPNQSKSCAYGYFSTLSTDGNLFPASRISLVANPTLGNGAQSRIVATNTMFHAFVPSLNASNLPTSVSRHQSTDGINWTDTGVLASFGPPLNNTPPAMSSTILYYAPLLAAQGYANGSWTVAFQINNNGWNNVYTCTPVLERGCGLVNATADDQFLAGNAVSSATLTSPGEYWVSYDTYASPRNPPLITQAIYFAPGKSAIGATTNSGIDPTGWTTLASRCPVQCYAAGDFHTTSSNPFASASAPFIKRSMGPAELFQSFVEDPQGVPGASSFVPNFVPFPLGADLTHLAIPLTDPNTFGLPPGDKVGF